MLGGHTVKTGTNFLAASKVECFLWCTPYAVTSFGLYLRERLTNERCMTMKMRRVKFDPTIPDSLPEGRVDERRLDATTEEDIVRQQVADDAESMQDAARFARRVRKRLGLTQSEFSRRIDVSLDTIRNWEQGKRRPTGAAKALLKILDKAPELALRALD
jgi:putative transcriptional regulator